jgi:hypothetical protein
LRGDWEQLRERDEDGDTEVDDERPRRWEEEGGCGTFSCFDLRSDDRSFLVDECIEILCMGITTDIFLGADGGGGGCDVGGNSGPSGRRQGEGVDDVATVVGAPVGATKTDRVTGMADAIARGAEGTVTIFARQVVTFGLPK